MIPEEDLKARIDYEIQQRRVAQRVELIYSLSQHYANTVEVGIDRGVVCMAVVRMYDMLCISRALPVMHNPYLYYHP